MVRLFDPLAEQHFRNLSTNGYVSSSAKVCQGAGTPTTTLGGPIGGGEAANAEFTKRMSKVESLHKKVSELQNGQTSMALTLACLSTNKAVHSLRLAGDVIDETLLLQYDDTLRQAVSSSLECDISNDSWEQSCRALDQGGLGIHLASEVALPAALASRLTAAPIIDALGTEMERAGITAQSMTAEFKNRTRVVERKLALTLQESPGLQEGLTRLCGEIRRAAEAKWYQYCGTQFFHLDDEDELEAASALAEVTTTEGALPTGPAAQRALVRHVFALKRNKFQ